MLHRLNCYAIYIFFIELKTPLTLCSAAAVASDLIAAPTKTPCFQLRASYTRGTPAGLRPPNKMAEIGTPSGSSHAGSIMGHCPAGVQNLQKNEINIKKYEHI